MNNFVVIRDYRPGDELGCQKIVRDATMSTVNSAFVSGLMRELTFQLIILTSALMFIFMGIPFFVCLASIPVVIVLMYVFIWLGHVLKAVQINSDMSNIPRIYMSSEYTGFWVAEVYEPFLSSYVQQTKYTIMRESDIQNMDLSSYRRSIVGTVAIAKSHNKENSAWLRRMAVEKKYQRKGIASALVDEALKFTRGKNYDFVELVTTECHDAARDFYLHKGFSLKQMYHKPIVGSAVTILMYEWLFKLKPAESP